MKIKNLIEFISNKEFLKQLLYLFLFIAFVVIGAMQWLKYYTHHGQKLEMPNYIGENHLVAKIDAEKKSFILIVEDSVHIVGKPGGEIVDQNPKAHAFVKQNRKVYVTRTKYNPDKISVASLPILYGLNYNIKSRELKFLNLNSKIKSYVYDPGEKDYILEVWYNNVKIIDKEGIQSDINIDKGGTLSFVLSKKYGGSVLVPNIRCKTYAEVKFMLEQLKLKIGRVNNISEKLEELDLYVIRQFPQVDQTVTMGDKVDITLSDVLPEDCQ